MVCRLDGGLGVGWHGPEGNEAVCAGGRQVVLGAKCDILDFGEAAVAGVCASGHELEIVGLWGGGGSEDVLFSGGVSPDLMKLAYIRCVVRR